MTKEQILEAKISCTCNEAYKSRQMADPDCGRCNWYEQILSCMEEYKEQEAAKDREKAAKLLKVLQHINFGIDVAASENANYVIETRDIQLIKQSLTEYKK